MMLAAAATVTADVSGGTMSIQETPMDGLTARWVIASLAVAGTNTGAAAVRFRILAANNSASVFQTIAASPAINATAFAGSASVDILGVGADGLEVNVRFGSDWDYIKYVIDTFGTLTLRHEGLGLVEDAVKFPQWQWFGDHAAYWVDGTDVAQA
jgi:hypothetical protein